MFAFLIGKMLKVFHSIPLVLYLSVLYCLKFYNIFIPKSGLLR